jgi:hypothetical protein
MRGWLNCCAVLMLGCAAMTAQAQVTQCVEPAPAVCHTAGTCHCKECGSQWEVDIRPYAWATALKGTQYAAYIPLKLDLSFSTILDNLDYAAFGEIELRHGKFSIIADSMVSKLSAAASADKTKLGPLGLTAIQGEADVSVDVFTYIQSLMLGYQVYDKAICDPCYPDSPRHFTIDALVGLRGYLLKTDVNASAKVTAVGPEGGTEVRQKDAKLTQRMDWIDPIVGARAKYDITQKLAMRLEGDIGGFGVGSDFAWNVSALVDYKICDHWTLFGGYRILDVDYHDGPKGFDAQFYGPLAGLQYKISF